MFCVHAYSFYEVLKTYWNEWSNLKTNHSITRNSLTQMFSECTSTDLLANNEMFTLKHSTLQGA